MKSIIRIVVCLCLPWQLSAQLLLSEVAPTNTGQIADEDSDHPDWIELYNAGNTPQFLGGMSLADGGGTGWALPDTQIQPGHRLLLFASGKNRGSVQKVGVDHWETAIYEGDDWRTFVGVDNPPADWASPVFDDSGWTSAPGGFGYGDGDDATLVDEGTIAFYYRRRFNVVDPAKLDSAILSMDYDDGFIAYLNGVEIFRSSNMPPGVPDYQTVTTIDHEALMYNGGLPEFFALDKAMLSALLVPGENVLAIELHNYSAASSDLSARSWLHFGISTNETFYGPNPSFFNGVALGGSPLHTDFKIGFGETIRLLDANQVQLDSVVVDYLLPGHALMRVSDSGSWCLTDTPTPNAPNGNVCFSGYAQTPGITPPAGFYQNQVNVSIVGNAVRYTTDGSEPTLASAVYTAPFSVVANTVVKARSFETNKLAGSSATATYLMNENSDLPVLSISARPSDLFDDGSGGLAAYDHYNLGLKAPAHLEYFDKNKQLAFSENASLRVVGGYSVEFAQKSLQFEFDEEFGARGEVQYPIFSKDKPGITTYRGFRIRNMDDDAASTRMRDVLGSRLALPTHCASGAYQNMAVFINGEYWGHYAGREMLNRFFVRDNHGSDPDQVDQIFTSYFQTNHYFPDEGTDEAFFNMSDYIIQNDMSDSAHFAEAKRLVDWENMVDYFALEMYLGNGDWFSSMYFNNLRCYRANNLRWRYLLFDVTLAQGLGVGFDANILYEALAAPGNPNRYTDMMNNLLQNPGFKNYFINRFADLLNEYWTPAKAHAIIDDDAAEIASEIGRQSQRWGTADPGAWQNEVSNLKDFHTQRRAVQRQQIQDYFGLNSKVNVTLALEPAGAGVVKISTIIPKSYPWSGVYFNGNPVTITAIPNPGFQFDHWTSNFPLGTPGDASHTLNISSSALFTAHFIGSAQPQVLDISEINYHSDPSTDAGDWFELQNNAGYALDISDYSVQDKDWYHRFVLPTGSVLQPGERMVVFENEALFNNRHPNVAHKAGEMGFGLDNSGDEIRLFDRSGALALNVTYNDKKPWPCTPDGFGRTLERLGNGDPNLPQSWFDGCMEGTPGTAYAPCEEQLIVSEINYHSAPAQDAGDWLELHNKQTQPISLLGWEIRDDKDEHVYTVPAGVTLPPGGYWVFCADEALFSARFPNIVNKTGDLGFSFSNGGDVIRIYDNSGQLRLSLCYDDDAPWVKDADGEGFTLENGDYNGNLNAAGNWFAGCPGGSPGKAYDPNCSSQATNVEANNGMQAFPNPADNQLLVRFSESVDGIVRLLDMWGRNILEQSVEGRSEVSLSVKDLPAGPYVLALDAAGVNGRLMVVVRR